MVPSLHTPTPLRIFRLFESALRSGWMSPPRTSIGPDCVAQTAGVSSAAYSLIVESSEYAALLTPAVCATQSGPMLVRGGDIHPDLNADSKSRKIRSGVGVCRDGTIVFALSRTTVTFYDFASLFLARLKCPNALFLDGDISAFYVPGMKDPM